MCPLNMTYRTRAFKIRSAQENVEQFKAKVNDYEEQGFSLDKAIHLAANMICLISEKTHTRVHSISK